MKKTGKIILIVALIAAMAGLVLYGVKFGAAPQQKIAEDSSEKNENKAVSAQDALQTAQELEAAAEAAWRDNTAGMIVCDDTKITAPAGVSVQGSCVTISEGGIYSVSGRLSEGQIFVESGDNVTLILADVSVSNSQDAAIKIKKAAYTMIYLPEGSDSTLQSGVKQEITAAAEAEENTSGSDESASAEGAALYSKDDLAFSGSGRLTVEGYINNAVATTDRLTVLGGELRVTAVNNGLKGKDSVTVVGGDIDITCGNDGIKSNNDEEEGCGTVDVLGGTINIVSFGDGVQAETIINVEGGAIDITAGDITAIGSTADADNSWFGDFGMGMPGGFPTAPGDGQSDTGMPEGFPTAPENGQNDMGQPGGFPMVPSDGQGGMGMPGGFPMVPDGAGNMPGGADNTPPEGNEYMMWPGGNDAMPENMSQSGGQGTDAASGAQNPAGADGSVFGGRGKHDRGTGEMPEGGGWTRPDGQMPEGGTEGSFFGGKGGRMPEGGAWTGPDGQTSGIDGTDPRMNGKGFKGQQENTSSDTSTKGLKSGSSLNINGGTITVRSQDDCVHSNGDLVIAGGELTLSTADDALHADNELTITDGTITVVQSYEGIEGHVITIKGGTIDVTSSDDGINAGGNAYSAQDGTGKILPTLQIEGGAIHVNAAGDGLDSNGDLIVAGGVITVDGPSDSANGALDSGTENGGCLVVNGGTILAIGASGMAESFTADSKQCSFIYNFAGSVQAGTEIKITDENGKVLFAHTAAKSFNSVVFSSPDLNVGSTVTLTAGETSAVIEITDITNGNAGGSGMFGGRGGRW